MDIKARINDLYNELIYLCEVRGELDPETNAKNEELIAQVCAELSDLEHYE